MDASQAQQEFLRELAATPPLRNSGTALHWQCADALRRAIETLHYPAAVPLPPEKELAAALGVSRPTLRHAMSRLVSDGVVHSQRGVGTFALRGALVRPVGLSSLYLDLVAAGRTPGTRVLAHETRPADDETASALGIPVGTPVLHLVRVRTADGVPIVLTRGEIALPAGVTLTVEQLERDGLYSLLHRVAGIELVGGTQAVSARRAHDDEVAALELTPGSAVLVAHRIASDAHGRGIEKTEIVYPEGTELVSDLRGTSLRPALAPRHP